MTQEKLQPGPIQKKWLQSLRDNPDRQYKGGLGFKKPDGSYKACCLGELGILAGVCEWDLDILKDGQFTGVLAKSFEKLGLNTDNGQHIDMIANKCLANLNDYQLTWPEIADHVEEHFEQYFNKSY